MQNYYKVLLGVILVNLLVSDITADNYTCIVGAKDDNRTTYLTTYDNDKIISIKYDADKTKNNYMFRNIDAKGYSYNYDGFMIYLTILSKDNNEMLLDLFSPKMDVAESHKCLLIK